MRTISQIITRIEAGKSPLWHSIFVSICFVLLRNIFEMFATGQDDHFKQVYTYSPFYFTLIAWLTWYFSLCSGKAPVITARVVLLFSALILLPPVLDYILTAGGQVRMRYMAVQDAPSLLKNLATVGMADRGISWGQRLEIISITICSFFYFYHCNGKILRSVIYAYGVYLWIFLFGLMLILMNYFFTRIQIMFVSDEWLLAKFYFILFLPALFLIYARQHKQKFKALLLDSRILRIIHYLIMFALGFALYYKSQPGEGLPLFYLDNIRFFALVLAPVAVFFGAIFSIIVNNLEDVDIDEVSNPDRPLVQRIFNPGEYRNTGWVMLFLSLAAAYLASAACLLLMALIIGIYFIYSAPPVRLKKVPVVNKFVLGLNSFLMALMGYTLFGAPALSFPSGFGWFLLMPLSLSGNFIDLKDMEGDKKAGIKTLPVLWGMRRAQWFSAIWVIITYAWGSWLLRDVLFTGYCLPFCGLTLVATAHLYFLLRKNYRELPVMLLQSCSFVAMIILILV